MSDLQHIPGTPSSNDEQHAQSEAMQARQPLPGAVLARERQARGWSVEYVASHLKLAIRQINALEEDRYEALPSPVVIRGFIRIYAKMLGIDAGALVAGLPATSEPAQVQIMPSRTLSTPFSESSLPLRGQHELPLARIAWIAGGVIVIAGLFAALKYGNWDEIRNSSLVQRLHVGGPSAKTETAAAPNADNADGAAAKPAVVADNDSAVPSEVVTPAPAASEPAPAASEPAPAPQASSSAPAGSPVAATAAAAAGAPPNASMTPAPAAPQVAANLANPLQLTITQDSWIEIRRADKSIVVSRIMKAGTTEAFNVDGAMSMVVGNAAGVEASLRGKPLALGSTTSNNVARLDLK